MTLPPPSLAPTGREPVGRRPLPDEPALVRALCTSLGSLLVHPRPERFADDLAWTEGLLTEAGRSGAAEALAEFRRATEGLSFERLQELYTRTFDLTPLCVPYLSVHLFGQESFQRANLMTGLEAAYGRAGIDRAADWNGELPDHLAVVLASSVAFGDDEWNDLVGMVLARPLARMQGSLEAAANPYRHLLEAVRRVLGLEHVEPEPPPEPHWKRRRRARGADPAPAGTGEPEGGLR